MALVPPGVTIGIGSVWRVVKLRANDAGPGTGTAGARAPSALEGSSIALS